MIGEGGVVGDCWCAETEKPDHVEFNFHPVRMCNHLKDADAGF